MDRRRSLAGSPPPIAKSNSCGSLTKTVSSSSLLLGSILVRSPSDLAAANGFGLAHPYRTDRKYKPYNMARSVVSLPCSPRDRAGSPLGFVATSASAPPTPRNDDAHAWECRVCGSTDTSQLEQGSDSCVVCQCGAVQSMLLVSQVRSKNCAKSEDKTVVADEPTEDADSVELEAFAHGPESQGDRRRRLLTSAGGSRVPARLLRKQHLSRGQDKINQGKARDMRDKLETDPQEAGKKRSIIKKVEAVFDLMNTKMHDGLQEHIRIETLRIYTASMEHEKHCGGGRGCLLSLALRPGALVSTCAVEHILQRLSCEEPRARAREKPLSVVAPGMTTMQIHSLLYKVRALQLRALSSNQRLQLLSAIDIISCWGDEERCRPCPPPQPPPPPLLRLPPSMMGNRDFGSGKCKKVDPAERAISKLQQCVISVAKISPPLLASVRNTALEALLFPSIKKFMDTVTLPADVVAISLTVAAARKLGRKDAAPPWHKELFRQHNIATGTVEEFTATLTELLKPLPVVKDECDIW